MLNKLQTYFDMSLPNGMSLVTFQGGIYRIALSLEDLETLADWFDKQADNVRNLSRRIPKEPEVQPCKHPPERRHTAENTIFCLDCHSVVTSVGGKPNIDTTKGAPSIKSVPVAKVIPDTDDIQPLTPNDAKKQTQPTLPDASISRKSE